MIQSIGRYELKQELGRGGMATVYLAHDPRVERDVALKLLPREFLHDPMFRARFEREAKTIAGLEHPAIVPLYDFGEEEGQPYLVMRFMSGGSLADRLNRGTLSLEETVRMFQRLASGLDEAHSRGIVHRDLKPGNVLLDKDNEPYLSDFGIVKVSEATAALTGSGIIGTPAYMSPEQAEGEGELDHRSDIYALGTILFECLTGRPPYQADTPMRVVVKHIKDPIPNILELNPELPLGIEKVIQKALAKQPDQRFPSASTLAEALAEVAEGHPSAVAPSAKPKETLAVSQEEDAVPAEIKPPAIEPPSKVDEKETRLVEVEAVPAVQELPELEPTRKRKGIPVWGWIVLGLVIVGGGIAGIGGVLGLFSTAPTPSPTETPQPTRSQIRHPTSTSTPSPSATPSPTLVVGIVPEELIEHFRESHDTREFTYETVKWSPIGKRFAVLGSSEGRNVIRIAEEDAGWDFIQEIVVETLNLDLLEWSPDGRMIVASGPTGLIQVWDARSGEELISFPVSTGRVNDVEWLDERILSLSTDGWLKTWWMPSGAQLGQLGAFLCCHDNLGGYGSASWSPDGNNIATIGSDGVIRIWGLYDDSPRDTQRLCCHDTTRVRDVQWSPDGSMIASLSGVYDGMADLYLWDVETEEKTATFNDYIQEVVWSPDGEQLAIAYSNRPSFAILNLSTLEFSPEIRIYDEVEWPDGTLWGGIDWSSDNHHIITMGHGRDQSGNIRIQDIVIWGMPLE